MRTIFAEYNPGRNSIDVYTSADYMLFLVSVAASVSTEQRSTGPLVPLYFPLSEFVNTGGTI